MFKHKLDEHATFRTYAHWFVLSFLAGNINAGGFLACGRFVSHVTGFATLGGLSLKEGSVWETIGILTIPGYFLIGVMTSGYLTEKRRANEIDGQKYAPVLWLVAVCMALATLGGITGFFGPFGESANLAHDYFLLALLCGACGLQNAAITSSSGSTVRTTHLTGLTTDLGLGIIRSEVHHSKSEDRARERKANLLRLGTIGSFMMGSFIGAIFYSGLHYLGFLLPMTIAIYASLAASRAP